MTENMVFNEGDMEMLHLLPIRIILARASLFSRINFTRYDLSDIFYDVKDTVLRVWDDRCVFLVFLPSTIIFCTIHDTPDHFFF